MHVRFIANMPSEGYSGGRLAALIWAESLSMKGVKVDFLIDNLPVMLSEFSEFSTVDYLKVSFDNLSPYVDQHVDIVIVVPVLGDIPFHGEALRHAIECGAKIVLMNFESPNWFNALSPVWRNPDLWRGWEIVSEYADMVLSISSEGNKYALEYYRKVRSHCLFEYCYLAINSMVADAAPMSERRKNIVILTRVDPHKGFDALMPLADSSLKEYCIDLFIGFGTLNQRTERKLRTAFDRAGMELNISSAIAGTQKFTMLKEASLLYFPTRFEGFGIPPLEAAYCLLPCACSDLPVLREFGRTALTYGDPRDAIDMLRAVHEAMSDPGRVVGEHSRICGIAQMPNCGSRLMETLSKLI